MGGGGLRILPHKKWHVWRRENIERVYRDEREYEEKQRDVDAKRRKVEQERRAEQLLSTKGHHRQEHINFFATEAALASPGTNGYRRKNHVGGSDETLRKHGTLPWYAQAKDAKSEMSAEQEKKSKRELDEMDPLHYMRPKEEEGMRSSFMSREENGKRCRFRSKRDDGGLEDSDRRKYSARYERSSTSPTHEIQRCLSVASASDDTDHAFTKGIEHKSKNKHKQSRRERMIEALRRERDEREATERRRAEKLLCQ